MITYIFHEGIRPHFDPITQDCKLVMVNGVQHWEITNHSIENRNDNGESYYNVMYGLLQRKAQMIRELRDEKEAWDLLSGSTQHNLEIYLSFLEKIPEQYEKGYTFPPAPPYDLTPVLNNPKYIEKALGI